MIETLIIGSGVAAASLASRLLANNPNASVVILEAGSKVKMQDAAIWQDYVVSGKLPYTKFQDKKFPERDRPGENLRVGSTDVTLDGARVITYGGTTIHWGGWSFRLKPEDFKLQSNAQQGIDWPIDYDTLEPYYTQAEHYLGVAGDSNDSVVPRRADYPFPAYPYTLQDQPMIRALDALNITYSHLPIARRGASTSASRHAPCQTTGTCKYCPFGARYSANNYLDDMLSWSGFPNFEVRLNCVVQQLTMSSKNQVTGVTYVDKADGELKEIAARRVIVAAGTFESTKLLQRSGNPFWTQGVGNDFGHLGKYLVTHPLAIFRARQNQPNNENLQQEMNFPTLVSRHFDSQCEQKKGKFILINPASSPALRLSDFMKNGLTHKQVTDALKKPAPIEIHAMIEVFPRETNMIANVSELNSMGLQQTKVDYSEDGDFKARVDAIQVQVQEILRNMNASLVEVDSRSVSWRADHAAGTTRMGKDETEGVTNSNLQVHGVDNLYVCSNSVLPNIGAVNPTLTLTALALRLGDHLVGLGNVVNREETYEPA